MTDNKRFAKINQILKYIEIAILIILPYFGINRGLNFTDAGYSIVNYVNFGRPDTYWSASTFGANALGALLVRMPLGDTYIGIKALCTVVLVLTAVGAYIYLSAKLNRHVVFAGEILAYLCLWCPATVLYNYLSYLFIVAALVVIYPALTKSNCRLLIIAGVILGMGVFVRISNAVYVLLIIPVVYYLILRKEKAADIFKKVLCCVGGFLFGFAVCFVACSYVYESIDAYPRMIKELFVLSDANYGYSALDMLGVYPELLQRYGKWIAFLLATCLIACIPLLFKKVKWLSIPVGLLSLVAEMYIIRKMSYWGVFTIHDYTVYYAIEVFVLIIVLAAAGLAVWEIAYPRSTPEIKMISGAVLVYILLIPVGTNTGFYAVINNMFVIMPFALGEIYKYLFGNIKKIKDIFDCKLAIRCTVLALLAISLFQFAMFKAHYVYGDVTVAELTDSSSITPSLKNDKMLPGMVGIVDELYVFMEENDLRDVPEITWGNIPLVSFMLGSKTAVSTGWPDLESYNKDMFARDLEATDQPVVIINKWFSGNDSDKYRLLMSYMADNGYEKIFDNDKFEVYYVEESDLNEKSN